MNQNEPVFVVCCLHLGDQSYPPCRVCLHLAPPDDAIPFKSPNGALPQLLFFSAHTAQPLYEELEELEAQGPAILSMGSAFIRDNCMVHLARNAKKWEEKEEERRLKAAE